MGGEQWPNLSDVIREPHRRQWTPTALLKNSAEKARTELKFLYPKVRERLQLCVLKMGEEDNVQARTEGEQNMLEREGDISGAWF